MDASDRVVARCLISLGEALDHYGPQSLKEIFSATHVPVGKGLEQTPYFSKNNGCSAEEVRIQAHFADPAALAAAISRLPTEQRRGAARGPTWRRRKKFRCYPLTRRYRYGIFRVLRLKDVSTRPEQDVKKSVETTTFKQPGPEELKR